MIREGMVPSAFLAAEGDGIALARRLWEWEPHPGQRDLLGARAAIKVAACGRRWGKTEALAVDVALHALRFPLARQMIVAPTYDQARLLFDRAEWLLVEAREAAERDFPHLERMKVVRSPYPRITFGPGRKAGTLMARTTANGGRGLRGNGVDRCIVDEAAFVDEAVIREVLMPMLATTPGGGELVLISSPWGRRGLFWEMFVKGMRDEGRGMSGGEEGPSSRPASPAPHPSRYWSCRFPSSQNPMVSAEYLAEQRAELPERVYRAEYGVEFVEACDVVFAEEDIRAALVGDEVTGPRRGARYVAGVDWGRRMDYTVVVVIEVAPVLRVVHLARMQGLTWAGQHERVLDVLARWGCSEAATDRTGVGDPLSESLSRGQIERRIGVRVNDVLFTNASKACLIDNTALALSQRRLVFPAYPDLLSELRAFTATPTRAGRERLEAARGGHDDCVCALALAVHAAGPIVHTDPSALVATGGRRASAV